MLKDLAESRSEIHSKGVSKEIIGLYSFFPGNRSKTFDKMPDHRLLIM